MRPLQLAAAVLTCLSCPSFPQLLAPAVPAVPSCLAACLSACVCVATRLGACLAAYLACWLPGHPPGWLLSCLVTWWRGSCLAGCWAAYLLDLLVFAWVSHGQTACSQDSPLTFLYLYFLLKIFIAFAGSGLL